LPSFYIPLEAGRVSFIYIGRSPLYVSAFPSWLAGSNLSPVQDQEQDQEQNIITFSV
jgi:hypothetical protein